MRTDDGRFEQGFSIRNRCFEYGIGAVLSQEMPDTQDTHKYKKNIKPVAFFSKSLNKQQRNYSVTEKELFAIVQAIEHWKYFLYARRFVIFTDHQPLEWVIKSRNTSGRLARWLSARISHFDFEIRYKRGKLNENADALSRWPLEEEGLNHAGEPEEFIINYIYVDIEDDMGYEQICYIESQCIETDWGQSRDDDIKWFIEVKGNNPSKPIMETFTNEWRKILVREWDNLVVEGNVIWR